MGWPYDDEPPSRGMARRRGARDFEDGKGRYADPYREQAREARDDYEWRRASREWEDAYDDARRAQERREEERRQEEQARREEQQRMEAARQEEWERLEEEQLAEAEHEYEEHCREVDAEEPE